jgi:hypothetical protein
MSPALLLAIAAACGGEEAGGGASVVTGADYAGPVGGAVELVPVGEADAESLFIAFREASWERRTGREWDDGTPTGAWARSVREGAVYLEESLTVPASVTAGSSAEGARVLSVGAREVWYGTFPDTVEIEVAAGPLAGTQVFAKGVGPIVLTLEGVGWELAGYGPAEPEEADGGADSGGGDTGGGDTVR